MSSRLRFDSFLSLSLSFLCVCLCARVSLRARVESKENAIRVLSCACFCKPKFVYSLARAFLKTGERECVRFLSEYIFFPLKLRFLFSQYFSLFYTYAQYSYSSKTSARSTYASSPYSSYHRRSSLSPFSSASSRSISTSCRGKTPCFFPRLLFGTSLREKSLTLYFLVSFETLRVFLGLAT